MGEENDRVEPGNMRVYQRADLSVTFTNPWPAVGMLTESHLRIEAPIVHFVELSAFEDTKNLRFGMLLSRRPFPRRVDGFDDGECVAGRRGRHSDHEIKPIAGMVIGASAPLE